MMTASILAVDESASMRRRVSIALDGAGYHVVEAADGVKALDTGKRRPVSPVIAEFNMPDVDGMALIRELHTIPGHGFCPVAEADPRVGFGTSSGNQDGRCDRLGRQALDPEQLLNTVSKVLS